jgi:peptidoglycan hydrolase-like protein with peptidoglycan-binding domain
MTRVRFVVRTLAVALAAPVAGVCALLPASTNAGATVVVGQVPSAKAQASIAAPAVAFARKQLGTPYRWGGTGPGGYDCSGLAYAAYQSAGLRLPRTSQQQYDGLPHVRLSELHPGDLVFFGTRAHRVSPSPTPTPTSSKSPTAAPAPRSTTSPKPAPSPSPTPTKSPSPSPTPTPVKWTHPKVHHVGIYIGDGDMIDAPHTGDVVKVQPIDRSDLIRRAARPALQLRMPIASGQTGFSVTQAQRLLAYTDTTVSVDGEFGSTTRHAVVDFQAAHDLPTGGRIHLSTWTALVDAEGKRAAAAVGNTPKPKPAPPAGSQERKDMVAPYRDTVLRPGDSGKAVKVLQQLLGNLTVDGDFGPATARAVKDYKEQHLLARTAVVGSRTWDSLARY